MNTQFMVTFDRIMRADHANKVIHLFSWVAPSVSNGSAVSEASRREDPGERAKWKIHQSHEHTSTDAIAAGGLYIAADSPLSPRTS